MPDCLTNATTRASVPSEGFVEARCTLCHTKFHEVWPQIREGRLTIRIKCERCKRVVDLLYTS